MSLSINDQYWYAFCKANPHVADCLANRAVLEDFAQSSGLLLEGFSADTYEFCANQIAERLAFAAKPEVVPDVPTPDELRQGENARLRSMTPHELHLEIRNAQKFVQPEIKLNYTALQIKQMEGRTLRALITYPNGQDRPGYRKAVDKILRGE